MEIIKRIFGGIITDGFFTALLWVLAFSIFTFFNKNSSESGFMGSGFFNAKMIVIIVGLMGMIIGCITGGIIGLLNMPPAKSALIGGLISFVIALCLLGRVPSKEDMFISIMFVITSTILAALASSLTAKIFNTPFTIK